MKIKKRTLYIILGAVFAILMWYFFFSTPSYEFKITPKPVLGNTNGTIHVIVYSDFQCPFCKQAHMPLRTMIRKYGNNVSLTFKHFPLSSTHPMAFKSAEASECASDQGKFWEYADELYARQETLSMGTLQKIAEDLSLNMKLFRACLASGSKAAIVTMEQREGADLGVTGTPAFFINDQKIENNKFEAVVLNMLGMNDKNAGSNSSSQSSSKSSFSSNTTFYSHSPSASYNSSSDILAVVR